jgi:2-oxoglutarate dehydrogenase E2 component (dihydrolipoamide succinyltransferase)
MPLPKPRKDEDRDSFLKRASESPSIINEFSTNEQRLSVASAIWDNSDKKEESASQFVKIEKTDEFHQVVKGIVYSAGQVDTDGETMTKEDVQKHIATKESAPTPSTSAVAQGTAPKDQGAREERVRMTKLRKVIASRLKEAQNTAAMLTTFNEVDMQPVMDLRKQYQDQFVKKHGIKLGFMSFFVKAAINALKEFPAVNAEIQGEELVYKNYYDIGVAVSTPQGLIVPVIRDADKLSMAEIEAKIVDLGTRARDGKLSMDEMTGGTFTITNGGIFGSMLSTPILNTPQSGILGMHNIVQRPVVMKDGSIQARPMMYLAMSYDHRIIDGREAVSSLVRIKEAIEDPQRLILDV